MEKTIKLTFIIIILLVAFIIFNACALHYYGDSFERDLYNFVWKFNFILSLSLAYLVYAFFNMLVEYRYPTEEDYEDFE